MKKFPLLLLFILIPLTAGGKYAGEFISGSTDARSLSLGGVITTSFYNPSAAFFNPAFLPEMKYTGVMLSHSERFEGLVRQEFAAYKTRISGIDAGISAVWLNVDGITLTRLENEDEDPGPANRIIADGTVGDNELAVFFSAGKEYTDKINIGASVKFLYKTFEIESASGLGFDISGLYNYNDRISFGLVLRDVTTSALFWTTGTSEFIRPSALFSGEFNGRLEYFLSDYRLIAGSEIRTEGYGENSLISAGPFDVVLSGGAELIFKNIFLRGGYNSGSTWSAGSGISFMNIVIDYAFKPDFEDLGNTHKVSLSYKWE